LSRSSRPGSLRRPRRGCMTRRFVITERPALCTRHPDKYLEKGRRHQRAVRARRKAASGLGGFREPTAEECGDCADSSEGERDDVRGRARSTGVAANGGHWGVFCGSVHDRKHAGGGSLEHSSSVVVVTHLPFVEAGFWRRTSFEAGCRAAGVARGLTGGRRREGLGGCRSERRPKPRPRYPGSEAEGRSSSWQWRLRRLASEHVGVRLAEAA
jgi:hypothetical protein